MSKIFFLARRFYYFDMRLKFNQSSSFIVNDLFYENTRRFPMVSYFLQTIFPISHTPYGLYVTRKTEKIITVTQIRAFYVTRTYGIFPALLGTVQSQILKYQLRVQYVVSIIRIGIWNSESKNLNQLEYIADQHFEI